MQLLNLLIKPVWILVIDRGVQNQLGTAAYGQYFIAFNLCTLLAVFLDVGINNYNVRHVSQTKKIDAYNFYSTLKSKLLLAALYLLLVLAIGSFYSVPLSLIFWLSVNQILITFLLFGRSNLSGLHWFKTDSIISILDRSIVILIFAPVLYFAFHFNIYHFVWAQSMAYFIAMGVVYYILIKSLKITPNKSTFKLNDILNKSWSFALLSVLMVAYTRLDVAMIEWLMDKPDYHAGIYAQSFRLLDALSIFAALFASMLLPKFSYMIKQKQNIKPITAFAVKTMLVPAIVLVVFLIFRSHKVLQILYHYLANTKELALSISTFVWLVPTFVFSAFIYIYSTIITAEGNMKTLNTFAAITLLFNVILNYFLIPKYGVKGAAIATFITQGLFALLCTLYAANKYGLGFQKNAFKFFGVIIFAYFLSIYLLDKTSFYWQSIIYVLSVGLAYMLLKIIKVSELKKMVQ